MKHTRSEELYTCEIILNQDNFPNRRLVSLIVFRINYSAIFTSINSKIQKFCKEFGYIHILPNHIENFYSCKGSSGNNLSHKYN